MPASLFFGSGFAASAPSGVARPEKTYSLIPTVHNTHEAARKLALLALLNNCWD